MLPDYPEYKDRAGRAIIDGVRARIPQLEPILGQVRHFVVHEGDGAHLTRADQSSEAIAFVEAHAELQIPKEQMKAVTAEQLVEYVTTIATQLAEHQARHMFATLERVTSEFGNTVDAKELGMKEALLEMERRIQMDFDPETLEPKGMSIVLHPSQVEKLMASAAEWEKDEEYVAKRAAIRAQKVEEWRARERARALAD